MFIKTRLHCVVIIELSCIKEFFYVKLFSKLVIVSNNFFRENYHQSIAVILIVLILTKRL